MYRPGKRRSIRKRRQRDRAQHAAEQAAETVYQHHREMQDRTDRVIEASGATWADQHHEQAAGNTDDEA